MSQPPDDHLKALWQGQEKETPDMTATAVRALARNYGDTIRGRMWLGLFLAALEVVGLGFAIWRAPNGLMRAGWVIVLAGLGWLVWRIVSKWPERLPPAATSTEALVDFHRSALERQKASFTSLTLSVAPIFVGMLVCLLGMQKARPHATLANFAPVLAMVAAWWLYAFVLQRRQAKKLAAQIAEMDQLRGG
jgi:hypothetical protein